MDDLPETEEEVAARLAELDLAEEQSLPSLLWESAAGSHARPAEGPCTAASVPSVHNFKLVVGSRPIFLHITLLQGSAIVWVGGARLGLDDLQFACPTSYDSMPAVATLRGDGNANTFASGLAKRFAMPIYLSVNLEPDDVPLPLLQKETVRLLEELLGRTDCAAPVHATS
eukprot:NODE_16461_length_993_cov_6.733256.p2 GENE.NODE_16461_length_993_cov_6.733256~~NODE_16461_length_993_cov_6.733256.p2  ORF type:complete len:171 (+),score=35.74 NODE_16461_length_993_cov_6.733256:87-599(+)